MTAEEAIKEIKERVELGIKEYYEDVPEYIEALKTAIEALEKQIPKKPVEGNPDDFWESGNDYCPICGFAVRVEEYKDKYCSKCGQAIDFGGEGEWID